MRKFTWIRMLLLILPALREALEELTDAIKKESDGGRKITKDEAELIAAAALAAIHGKLVALLRR